MLEIEQRRTPVEVKVGHAFGKIVGAKHQILHLYDHFSAISRGAKYTQSFKTGRWDGKYHFVQKTGVFGIGLLDDLVQYLDDQGWQYSLTDLRGAPPEKEHKMTWDGFKLRPEQQEAKEAMQIRNNGIIKMQTGTGKTETFSSFIADMGLLTMICVPTQALLHETSERVRQTIIGARVGLLGDGHTPSEEDNIVVATYQSLVKLYNDLGKKDYQEAFGAIDLLICDECHKVGSRDKPTKSWHAVMGVPAYYRYGFSATPWEQEGTVAEYYLRTAFGRIIYSFDAKAAMEAGRVVPMDAVFVDLEYPPHYTMGNFTEDSWQVAHEEYIVNNEIRNTAIRKVVKTLRERGEKVLVVAQRIPHNDLLFEDIAEDFEGDKVWQFHGQLAKRDRQESYAEYKDCKEPCVLVASSIANMGLDVKDISAVVVAHGGKSFFEVVQRAGRGLRLHDDKEKLMLVDFNDTHLGRWFANQYRQRRDLYKSLGATLKRGTA